ncbi:hypothetical protein BJ165DRAFT_1545649 [Panaeolus papilionaceus]|nr:hypothetical protein BJ165DRAFT_1545649 [Panaeolus papilionaceus]
MMLLAPGSKVIMNNPTILHEQITVAGNQSPFHLLQGQICMSAFHHLDEVDRLQCHQGTRLLPLQQLEDWATSLDDQTPIRWLTGPAASGKTSIARSLISRCTASSNLAASFFFRKSDPERVNGRRLVPTIAYQIAKAIPPLRSYMVRRITQDPTFFSEPLQRQLESLIFTPLREMQQDTPGLNLHSLPHLIVIDGLDECVSDTDPEDHVSHQQLILNVIRLLVSRPKVFPFRVVFSSRSLPHIRQYVDKPTMKSLSRSVVLDASMSPQRDISTFVTHWFTWIVNHHPERYSLPTGWPGHKVIETIVEKSSGHFHYAAFAMKLLRSEGHKPDVRLQILMGRQPACHPSQSQSSFAELDLVYLQVLNSAPDHETTHRIITFHQVHPPSTFDIPLHSLERTLEFGSSSISHMLAKLEPILDALPNSRELMRFHHSSFVEFLHDETRAQRWYINIAYHAERLALGDLEAFEKAEGLREQEFWFQCFCDALRRAEPSIRLKESLTKSWLSLSSYHPGCQFFENCGLKAHERFVELQASICSSLYSECERRDLNQHLINSFKSVLHPYVLPYRSNVSLCCLFLFYVCYGPFSTGPANWSQSLRSLVTNDVARHFDADIMSIDNNALHFFGHDNTRNTTTSRTLWLQQLLRHFYYFDLHRPVDDELLRESSIKLIRLLKLGVENWDDRIRVVNCIEWLLRIQMPSRPIVDLLADNNMHPALRNEMRSSKIVQGYIQRAYAVGIVSQLYHLLHPLDYGERPILDRICSQTVMSEAIWKPKVTTRYYALSGDNFKHERVRTRRAWSDLLDLYERGIMVIEPDITQDSQVMLDMRFWTQGVSEPIPDFKEVPCW